MVTKIIIKNNSGILVDLLREHLNNLINHLIIKHNLTDKILLTNKTIIRKNKLE